MENVSSSNSHKALLPKLRFSGFEAEYQSLQIGDFASCCAGATPSTNNKTFWENGTIPWLSSGEVNKKRIYNTDTYITQKGYDSCSTKLIPANTVVMALAGQGKTRGNVAITQIELCTNQSLAAIITNSQVDDEYLLYYLETQYDNLRAISSGNGTRGGLNLQIIREYKITLPILKEQKKVAEFFTILDKRIDKQRNLIDTLISYKRGAKNKFFDNPNNDWKEVPLSTILTERKSYCEKDGTYPHATLSKEGVSAKTERYDRDYLVSSDNKKYKITHYGDICYNPANLKFGVICLNSFGDAIFSPIYVTFEVNEQYDTYFIGDCVTHTDFINKALQFQQGTVYERMAVSPEDLLSMAIKVPSLAEQVRIAKCLQSYDLLIEKHVAILTNLVSMKKSLLSQLFI